MDRASSCSSPQALKRSGGALDNHVMREGARLASGALRAKISGGRGRLPRDVCAICPQALGRPCKKRRPVAEILVRKLLFGHLCISKSKAGLHPRRDLNRRSPLAGTEGHMPARNRKVPPARMKRTGPPEARPKRTAPKRFN